MTKREAAIATPPTGAPRVIYYHTSSKTPPDLVEAVKQFPGVTLVHPPLAELGKALAGAEILIASNRAYDAEAAKVIRDHGRDLRWIQFSTSGCDNAINNGMPSGLVVTNVAGLRAFAVAEHALSLMLALVRQLRYTESSRPAQRWVRDEITPSMDNLCGKRLLIIGVGAIGEEIARKAKAFDMHVTGVSRRKDKPANFDALRPREELVAAAADADVVALAATQDGDTGPLVNRALLDAMKPTALVINIARGSLVEEPALIEALQSKKIAGAGLDVASKEPLPEGHPFWGMSNVVLTPHLGGAGNKGLGGGLGSIFADNLTRYIAGKPLTKIVFQKTP